ncbi:rhomboid family intramembrane serine protease [Maledivibacter halophilus]|uniref:Membrane associated serine protease, rhomboid family n=1 Tax=Maledivibacter halophilus TaxID=36842 RepID=A0A1T5IX36_9FIRM|nr:rhomboid family intramembrane serine protease [Maledivibacter halophilus]SKC43642.1 Membrane associated serine protease, rhomboid family [Maledivibacter halophilus]
MIKYKKFYLSHIIIAINSIIFILMFLVDKSLSFNVYTLIDFGAKYNPLIASGEYYRLITPIFLHSDITHILFNMYALNILGKNIEIIYGRVKFIIIYLTAGLFGSLGSFIFTKSVAVGASGAIFGLFGAYIYLYISRPNVFNTKFLKNLLSIIGLNLFLGIVFPNIDNWAHIWGLVGGIIISWAIGIKGEKTFSPKKIITQILTVLLICTSLTVGIKINKDSWQYNLFKGIDYLKENKINKAESEFNTGISRNDNVEDFHYYLGHINLSKGNIQKAIYHFEKAIEINPGFTEAKQALDNIK